MANYQRLDNLTTNKRPQGTPNDPHHHMHVLNLSFEFEFWIYLAEMKKKEKKKEKYREKWGPLARGGMWLTNGIALPTLRPLSSLRYTYPVERISEHCGRMPIGGLFP